MPAITLVDPAATAALGRAIAAHLRPGDLVLLDGPLGAGKTTLVRALVEALDGDPALVASPTFTLMNRYDGRMPVYHVDAYRLDGPGQLAGLGFEELREEGLGIVEWSDRVVEARDRAGAWRVRLAHAAEGTRNALVEPPTSIAGWSHP